MNIRFKSYTITSQIERHQGSMPPSIELIKRQWAKQDEVSHRLTQKGKMAADFTYWDKHSGIQFFGVATEKDALSLRKFVEYKTTAPALLTPEEEKIPTFKHLSDHLIRLNLQTSETLQQLAFLRAERQQPKR